ncbi:hypothetical protein DFJ58DRAFT_737265 [Suillus subalutaceus]|uniref:uncharacterized protein n=1 Tax=Suillus subalutaceus TaxID=48586 RepID=UPI001B87F403|nr:uncharacterized protein DFJ58DRAFT_737265 [Suillus subalutaceus]KAG1829563.1 hypothetical protein DFJ58DRAFT_737265 [Suillus subalutaceus]
MPPKAKARAAAIHLGIARSAPGRVDIGSLTLQDPSIAAPVSRPPAAHDMEPPIADITKIELDHLGTFCHFCSDGCDATTSYTCVKCGAVICHQTRPGGSGCIAHDSVPKNWEFLCPLCARKVDGKERSLPYKVIGYGMRKRVKKAWPACIVHITLDSMKDQYLKLLINLDLVTQYKQSSANLTTASLAMKAGAHDKQSRLLTIPSNFITTSMLENVPSNTFVIMDTHSDEYTGMLQHTGGASGGTNTTAAEIIQAYLGKKFIAAMRFASKNAREDESVETTAMGGTPWCDTTPKARGGRRGLILVTCGPAIRVSHHFDSLLKLVKEDVFDFIVGFGGASTLPVNVGPMVQAFVRNATLFGIPDVWDSLCELLASSPDVLDHNTVVIVYGSYVEGKRIVESREIGKHRPPYRAFGHEFSACAKEGCRPAVSDNRVSTKNGKVRITCAKCQWTSAWVAIDKDNEYFFRVKPTIAPMLFWHHFPPSSGLNNFFVNATRDADRKGSKGKKRQEHNAEASNRRPAKRRRPSSSLEGSSSDGNEGSPMTCE